ncbi:MAG: hypothetical protein ACI9LY_002896, partial [Arenicella sp.]
SKTFPSKVARIKAATNSRKAASLKLLLFINYSFLNLVGLIHLDDLFWLTNARQTRPASNIPKFFLIELG